MFIMHDLSLVVMHRCDWHKSAEVIALIDFLGEPRNADNIYYAAM